MPPRPPVRCWRPASTTMPGTSRSSRKSGADGVVRRRPAHRRARRLAGADLHQLLRPQHRGGRSSPRWRRHPFLSDLNVRKALAAAIDRETIVSPTLRRRRQRHRQRSRRHRTPRIAEHHRVFDTDEGNRLLDEAGWALDGDFRAKDGVTMKVAYATTVNQVRQKTQAIVKQGLEAIGVEVEPGRSMPASASTARPATTRLACTSTMTSACRPPTSTLPSRSRT